jgi:AmpD protein
LATGASGRLSPGLADVAGKTADAAVRDPLISALALEPLSWVWSGDGWLQAAEGLRLRRVPSPNFGPRPAGVAVNVAVLHSISLPPGVYGGDAIERLFTNTLDCSAHPYFEALRGLEVSAHCLLRRDGEVLQFVSTAQRAWHAGRSAWQGRANCNDYSVGIELEGLEGESFAPVQYAVLTQLLLSLRQQWPLTAVVGHEHVAPGRKADPGAGFDWSLLAQACRAHGWQPQWPDGVAEKLLVAQGSHYP